MTVEIIDKDKLAIMLDMGVAMATFTMAVACEVNEVYAFFEGNKSRLRAQGFELDDIDEMSEQMKTAVLQLKSSLREAS